MPACSAVAFIASPLPAIRKSSGITGNNYCRQRFDNLWDDLRFVNALKTTIALTRSAAKTAHGFEIAADNRNDLSVTPGKGRYSERRTGERVDLLREHE